MTFISEEDVQAIAMHAHGLKTAMWDLRMALNHFDWIGRLRKLAPEPHVGCAIIGCANESYWRGYCRNHYAKRRRFAADGILPAAWVENAAQGSVADARAWDLKWAIQKGGAS